jgi:hypothetical protein
MSAATVVIRQNRFIRAYGDARATSPGAAATPQQLGIRPSWIFNRMAAAGVFVHVGQGRYYLDAHAAHRFRARRRAKILILVGVCVLVWLIYIIARGR